MTSFSLSVLLVVCFVSNLKKPGSHADFVFQFDSSLALSYFADSPSSTFFLWESNFPQHKGRIGSSKAQAIGYAYADLSLYCLLCNRHRFVSLINFHEVG